MKDIIQQIEDLKNDDEIYSLINTRMEEFRAFKDESKETIFKELCFCIMTANCSAGKCMEVHENIGDGFLTLSEKNLSTRFQELGYRFPNIRANYIVENRKFIDSINDIIKSKQEDGEIRNWIAKTIKGLGFKESSHFLRNIGFKNCAIIDFHIIDLLVKQDLIQKPKTLTKKKYIEIEKLLGEIGSKLNLNLGCLDLYMWYLETGKILK